MAEQRERADLAVAKNLELIQVRVRLKPLVRDLGGDFQGQG